MSSFPLPVVKSLQDLSIIEAFDPETNTPKYTTFYYTTADNHIFFGQLFKNKRDITFAEFTAALEPVSDDEIYPLIPTDIECPITTAPDDLTEETVHIKGPALVCYEDMKGTPYLPSVFLAEILTMETLSRSPHPNIVTYHGCRTQRGRITQLLIEKLPCTLQQYITKPEFQQLDRDRFFSEVQSALDHIHGLGMAHNDICPGNIMVKDGRPVLIDFGSCAVFGAHLKSLGSPGWYKEEFFKSEKEHDEYSMSVLKTWLKDPK